MINKNSSICVVGAGIAGLTAAYFLKKQGFTKVVVYEKQDRVGGKCWTVSYDGDCFDMGGHEMLGGYTDLLALAKEVGAETRKSIDPVIYDSNQKKYLNFKESVLASGYSLLKVPWAAMRYAWLTGITYRKFSKPNSSFADTPEDLMKPLQTWLAEKKLQAIIEILMFVIKVQGYGSFDNTSAAYFVKFMGIRNWLSLLLSGMKIWTKYPRVFTKGSQNLCELVAKQVNVKLSSTIEKIERNQQVKVYLKGKEKPEVFDYLILSTPLDLESVSFLDLSDQEKELFGKIDCISMATTLCSVEGLPAGVVASIPMNEKGYTGYIKDYQQDRHAVFFSLIKPEASREDIIDGIKSVLTSLPPYEGKQAKILEAFEQKKWKYFPHVSPVEYASGFYKELETLQGQANTYYASSLFSFEIMGNTCAYAKRLIQEQFRL